MHCRWAMLGLAGMVGPELLTKIGAADLPNWIDAGNWDGYWLGAGPLFFVQMAMMNWAEIRRWEDMKNPGTAYDDPKIGKDSQPAHMDDLYTGWGDNQGVHINSGIPNKAFCEFAIAVGGAAWKLGEGT